MDTGHTLFSLGYCNLHLVFLQVQSIHIVYLLIIRGYQEVAENITLGKPDMHEAIDVSFILPTHSNQYVSILCLAEHYYLSFKEGFADLVKPVLFSVIGKWKLGNMEPLVNF